MKLLTLERPGLCRAVLLLPILLPVAVTAIGYALFPNAAVLAAGILLCLTGTGLYFEVYSTYFGMIGVIAYCAKRNFEVHQGGKVTIQRWYRRQYHMTLSEFIRSMKGLMAGNRRALSAAYHSMDDDSFRHDEEALYYRDDSGHLLALCWEKDEDGRYHLDSEICFWSYPCDDPQQISKKERAEILKKAGRYLSSHHIPCDYDFN